MSVLKRKSAATAAGEDENPYLLSFADILAGLLVIFILALVTLMVRLDQQRELAEDTNKQVQEALAELSQIEELRRELLEEVKVELEKYRVYVEISDNHSVLRIPEEQLHFESGKHDIPPEKSRLVDVIGKVLMDSLLKAERLRFVDTIFIEGHTDSQPLIGEEMGNWGLSAYRAIAVWQHWTENPGHLRRFTVMTNRQGKPLFSVSGYAETRRVVVPDNTPETRQQNRRIDIRFTMRSPVTGDLMNLLDKFRDAGIK